MHSITEIKDSVIEECAELCRQANLGRISAGLHLHNLTQALNAIIEQSQCPNNGDKTVIIKEEG